MTNSFICDVLPDQVWWRNIKRFFELFQNLHLLIYANQFMASWRIPLSFVLLNLESVERKEKKLQKLKHFEKEKSFLDEIKSI